MSEKSSRRERRTFSPEFKEAAVRMVDEGKLPMSQIATDLGVHVTQLRSWRDAFHEHTAEAFPGRGNQRELEAKVTQLQRALKIKEQEVEILKKATAFFAREM
jgi:transposase